MKKEEKETMIINLEHEQNLLLVEIENLESQIAPIQKKLQELRERLSHVNALLAPKTEGSIPEESNKVKRGTWAELCRQNNWHIGGDSPHRVVRRKDPKLHSSIPHKCNYDGRTYP